MDRDVLKSKLLQGVTSGQLTIGDLGVFEIGNTLTKNAEIYLAGQK